MKKISSAAFLPIMEFTRRLFRSGGVSVFRSPLLLVYYLQLLIGMPFAFFQTLIYRKQIAETEIKEAPIFILGHYRTGTTLLQKLLTTNDQFGFLTYYDAIFPNSSLLLGTCGKVVFQRIIKMIKLKNPFFNNLVVNLDEADEEDDYLMNLASPYSAYWGLIFPKKWRDWLNLSSQFSNPTYQAGWRTEYLNTLQYLTFRNNGKRLVLKSPPNSERIRFLLEMFPEAKFIFIRRNPYQIYYSMRNMWKNTILRYYSLQRLTDSELDEIVFGHFNHLMGELDSQRGLIKEGNYFEVNYEDLKSAPYGTISLIYEKLKLPGFDKASEELQKQIELEKGYKNFRYDFQPEVIHRIKNNWHNYIDKWGYLFSSAFQDPS